MNSVPPEDEEAPARPNILLVDDTPANLLALEAVLEPLGHRLVKASSGKDALRQILAQPFALILMDVEMPGLDGFETVAMIKERRQMLETPVIFLTAHAKEPRYVSRGYEHGAIDYIMKPFEPDLLRAKVATLITLQQQADRLARQRELLAVKRHELQMTELERSHAESANRMKDQFLAVVSHELRTPLNAIIGWAQMLSKGELDQAKTERAIEIILRNAQLQKQIVDDLLDLSKIILGAFELKLEPMDVAVLIDNVVDSARPQAESMGVVLSTRIESAAVEIVADRARIHQVVANLVSNALKFTPRGKSVEVALERAERGVSVSVSDSGIGIDSADLSRVFERFWQSPRDSGQARSGLGLGLAIVRQLVDLHGGEIDVYSEGMDKGTRFTVTLDPAGPGPAQRIGVTAAERRSS